jgi:hypothetical protein
MLSAQSIIKADGTSESYSTPPRVVTPGILTLDRFKANVPSLVVRANPLTIPFGYIDAGIEYRNQHSGWILMNHSYFGNENSFRSYTWNGVHVMTKMFVRLEASKRWYRTQQSMFRLNQERFAGIYFISGFTNTSTTSTFESDANGFSIPVGPYVERTRIDLILGAEFGKTRNLVGLDHPLYYETSWKLGYNLGSQDPQILWGIRFNYKVN